MKNLKKEISLIISENLTRLYAFAHLLTSNDKDAEKLIHSFLAEIFEYQQQADNENDLRTNLFRTLYRLSSAVEGLNPDDFAGEFTADGEAFYLYNRLEEKGEYDRDEILEFIADIEQAELDRIIAGIPAGLRPYRFLHYTCEFSYRQIAAILNVPLESVELRMAQVNRIIQTRLWKKIANKKQEAGILLEYQKY
jgi:DNA-directed RNA polymerase specialized sigma24 family protein